MKTVAMIPARMGSQRLKKKNLAPLAGQPLITHAVEKCQASGCFDEIYINSENAEFSQFAEQYGIKFYQRPEELGNSVATSEQFVYDFLKNVDCDLLAVSGGWNPAGQLYSQAGGRLRFDAGIGAFVPGATPVLVEMGQQNQPVARRAEIHRLIVRSVLEANGMV